MKRLTYKRGGRWIYSGHPDKKPRPIKPYRIDLHAFRVIDRVVIGKDNGRNHW